MIPRMRLHTLAILAAAATLAACATRPPLWYMPGETKTEAEFQQDALRCTYEAAAATANVGTNMFGAVTMAASLDRELRKRELARMCMFAKGYRIRQE